jgi:hypothetical protein
VFPQIPESDYKIISEHDSADLMNWQDGFTGF